MSGKLFLKAKNEETLLPRVLRVLSKQGVDVQELNMKVQSDGMELEIVLILKVMLRKWRSCWQNRSRWFP